MFVTTCLPKLTMKINNANYTDVGFRFLVYKMMLMHYIYIASPLNKVRKKLRGVQQVGAIMIVGGFSSHNDNVVWLWRMLASSLNTHHAIGYITVVIALNYGKKYIYEFQGLNTISRFQNRKSLGFSTCYIVVGFINNNMDLEILKSNDTVVSLNHISRPW